MQASRAAVIKLLSTLDEGEYLGRPIRHMYGRVVMYDCTRRAYALVLLHMERIRAGVLEFAVDIRAVRAAPERDCSPGASAMVVLLPLATAVAAIVSLAVALAAIQGKRSAGHSTVRLVSSEHIVSLAQQYGIDGQRFASRAVPRTFPRIQTHLVALCRARAASRSFRCCSPFFSFSPSFRCS